jgi:hypothetical protein
VSKTITIACCAILGAALVGAAAVISRFQLETARKQTISVKGYAKSSVTSDVGVMRCRVSARHADRVVAMQSLHEHRDAVVKHLSESGIEETLVEIGIPNVDTVATRDKNGRETNEIQYHDATLSISVTSSNVDQIAKVSRGVAALAADGVHVNVYDPEFLIANPDNHKLKLIADATRNAHERAQILATDGGGNVGKLKSARQGVFQITQPNSTATSSYGIYDTSTITKEIKAVVTLEYEVVE